MWLAQLSIVAFKVFGIHLELRTHKERGMIHPTACKSLLVDCLISGTGRDKSFFGIGYASLAHMEPDAELTLAGLKLALSKQLAGGETTV